MKIIWELERPRALINMVGEKSDYNILLFGYNVLKIYAIQSKNTQSEIKIVQYLNKINL